MTVAKANAIAAKLLRRLADKLEAEELLAVKLTRDRPVVELPLEPGASYARFESGPFETLTFEFQHLKGGGQ